MGSETQKTCKISETVQDRTKVTMILNGRNVTLAKITKFYGTHQKNFNEDRPILSAAKCRPMILVSRSIRYMPIFAGGFLGDPS